MKSPTLKQLQRELAAYRRRAKLRRMVGPQSEADRLEAMAKETESKIRQLSASSSCRLH